jgi:hypothetical protein
MAGGLCRGTERTSTVTDPVVPQYQVVLESLRGRHVGVTESTFAPVVE